MANKNMRQAYSLDTQPVDIYVKVEMAAAGAIESFSGNGVSSVAKGGTGILDITLQDKYNKLLMADAMLLSSSAKDFSFQIEQEAVASAGTLSVFMNVAGTETDPADGDLVYLRLTVKNSSVSA